MPGFAGNPLVPGAILVEHHASIGSPGPLFPMCPFQCCLGYQSLLLKGVFDPCVASASLISTSIPAVKVFGIETTETIVIKIRQCHYFINRRTSVCYLP